MSVEITIPSPGESVNEVTVGTWLKKDGDWVEQDEAICEIESDKATLEVGSPAAGVLHAAADVGTELEVGAVLGTIDTSAKKAAGKKKKKTSSKKQAAPVETELEPAAAAGDAGTARASTMARKLAEEKGVNLETIPGSGPAGRIMKADVLSAAVDAIPAATDSPPSPSHERTSAPSPAPPPPPAVATGGSRGIRRERMTKLRQKVAERLVASQQNAAMLTTFNEVDMSAVMNTRSTHKEGFEKKHGVRLGFMSFFLKAAVSALQNYPKVNAYIVDKEIQFHDYCDIAVAVGTDRGLVVPVIRNAESMGFAQLEWTIADFARRARDGQLGVDEMTGGTFTVSNGGVYGSMMSTPILNPPQSGILGMHGIKKRAVEDPDNPGQIVLRPMMYLALSYDHRIIDGTEAVGFLKHIKECIEDPARLMLDM
ncbi:MAG: 2-oxoglutarate dehydrogenase complex dihydrolipoyllysine-residue succinyltransferase [Phycisphaerales bacterium]|nr:2-oxoglutarate dehydrogenase complex dihydrolipoyllysine-residue succinyltransferase [Phycisphaerales bacterium]